MILQIFLLPFFILSLNFYQLVDLIFGKWDFTCQICSIILSLWNSYRSLFLWRVHQCIIIFFLFKQNLMLWSDTVVGNSSSVSFDKNFIKILIIFIFWFERRHESILNWLFSRIVNCDFVVWLVWYIGQTALCCLNIRLNKLFGLSFTFF